MKKEEKKEAPPQTQDNNPLVTPAPVQPIGNPQQPQQQPMGNQNPPVQQPPQEQLDPSNEIVSGHANKEEVIAELEGMGFPRLSIEQALAAAFYNKERAIDYLLNVG